ncbi:hypothetical protein GCM10027266_01100 [Arenimonas alkanexedens]
MLFIALTLVFVWREWTRQVSAPEPSAVQSALPSAPIGPAPADPAPLPARVAAPSAPLPEAATTAATPAASEAARASPSAPAAMPPAPADLPFAAAEAVAVAVAVPVAAPAAPPSAETLPTLASLDAGTRAQLPPLKLSMHVFADEPAQRFVIVDGRRLGEGASPAAGVVLEEIRRDGLVISVNGQRLLLARP